MNNCNTMGAFVCVGVGVSEYHAEDPFVRFGAKPTQRARFPTRPKEDEEKQGSRAGNRNRGKATVRERLLLSEELEPVDSEAWSANARGRVSVPGDL